MDFPLLIMIFASLFFGNTVADGTPVVQTMQTFFPELQGDMTKVTWSHGCNTGPALDAALTGDVMMIEADVIVGHLESNPQGDPIPVLGYPPSTTGDVSLEDFLNKVAEQNKRKGIKLVFKSTDSFKASEIILQNFLKNPKVDFPVWISADVVKGPGMENTKMELVNARYFLSTCFSKLPKAYVSIGWAVDPKKAKRLEYVIGHILEVALELAEIDRDHGVSFRVHAGIASRSVSNLEYLTSFGPEGTTLTLWAAEGEWVDYVQLRNLIRDVGRDKVFIDMPKVMIDALNGPPPNFNTWNKFSEGYVSSEEASSHDDAEVVSEEARGQVEAQVVVKETKTILVQTLVGAE